MTNNTFPSQLHDAVENYYQFNPDTLMPLLLLALAAQGKLNIGNEVTKSAISFCSLQLEEIANYDWVKNDPSLKKRLKAIQNEGGKAVYVLGEVEDSLKDIYETFYQYDNVTVEQEYHHRIGILYHHSINEKSEKAHRQYATICLAKILINSPKEWIQECYVAISNHILVKSGLQPERPRIAVASALNTLLQIEEGNIYYPFAGCAIASALTRGEETIYADCDRNDKVYAAARILNYGAGHSLEYFEQKDSTKWIDGVKPDYIMSTYLGYINGQSAFDFCLSKCLNDNKFIGKYAGIIAPKDIFENPSNEFKEALKRDWVDTIVLLRFGEVAILIDAQKAAGKKGVVRFYNFNHPFLRKRNIVRTLQDDTFADFYKVKDIQKKGFLKAQIVPELQEREGYELIRLGDIIEKLPQKTYKIGQEGATMAYIEKSPYNMYNDAWMNNIGKRPINALFSPAYHLEEDCLITTNKGLIEPRLFDIANGDAYFQEGFAFSFKIPFDEEWLITELNAPYVINQLHPYGLDKMLPEHFTEEQILDLKIYQEIEEDDLNTSEKEDDDKLPEGFVLNNGNIEYTIHRFLGHGCFGYTYTALSNNLTTGEKKEVVLKEFYSSDNYHRQGNKIIINDRENLEWMEEQRAKFIEEAKIMNLLGNIPDSHIVAADFSFYCDSTGTCYYTMPCYTGGSLNDLIFSNTNITEDLVINSIVIPLCKALHTGQQYKILHLDIKPENVLIDDNGDAILIDFGVAKRYDEEGHIIDRQGTKSCSPFSPPEVKAGNVAKYDPRPDIFGLAATLFNISTKVNPAPIMELDDKDVSMMNKLKRCNFSCQYANALIKGLQGSLTKRPVDAQAFLNLFPGCENIKL